MNHLWTQQPKKEKSIRWRWIFFRPKKKQESQTISEDESSLGPNKPKKKKALGEDEYL